MYAISTNCLWQYHVDPFCCTFALSGVMIILGVDIVRKALKVPITQIVKNTGIEPTQVVDTVLKAENNMGYDALASKHVDMMQAGIVDPTKVCAYVCVTVIIAL